MDSVNSRAPIGLTNPEAESLSTIAELAAGLEDRLLRAVGRTRAGGVSPKV